MSRRAASMIGSCSASPCRCWRLLHVHPAARLLARRLASSSAANEHTESESAHRPRPRTPWGPCRHGARCTRPGCSFMHPAGHTVPALDSTGLSTPRQQGKQQRDNKGRAATHAGTEVAAGASKTGSGRQKANKRPGQGALAAGRKNAGEAAPAAAVRLALLAAGEVKSRRTCSWSRRDVEQLATPLQVSSPQYQTQPWPLQLLLPAADISLAGSPLFSRSACGELQRSWPSHCGTDGLLRSTTPLPPPPPPPPVVRTAASRSWRRMGSSGLRPRGSGPTRPSTCAGCTPRSGWPTRR